MFGEPFIHSIGKVKNCCFVYNDYKCPICGDDLQIVECKFEKNQMINYLITYKCINCLCRCKVECDLKFPTYLINRNGIAPLDIKNKYEIIIRETNKMEN